MIVTARDLDWFYKIDELSRSERLSIAADFITRTLERAPERLTDWLGDDADRLRAQVAEWSLGLLGFWGSESDMPEPLLAPRRVFLDRDIAAGGWHAREHGPTSETFRWTGPGTISEFPLGVLFDRPYRVRIRVPLMMPGMAPGDIELLEDGVPMSSTLQPVGEEGYVIEATVRPTDRATARDLRLTLRLPRTVRPLDLGINEDSRALGCAVHWIDLEPIPEKLVGESAV